jgi:hypothetical protein
MLDSGCWFKARLETRERKTDLGFWMLDKERSLLICKHLAADFIFVIPAHAGISILLGSFIGVDARNEARLSKLEGRQDLSSLSFPRKRESRDFYKTCLPDVCQAIVIPAHTGITVLRVSVGIYPIRDCFVGLRLTKTSSNDNVLLWFLTSI